MISNNEVDKRIRAWISFAGGMTFTGYFTFFAPGQINPYLMFLISGLLFGPSVFTIMQQGGPKRD
jgi:hypothetical protein